MSVCTSGAASVWVRASSAVLGHTTYARAPLTLVPSPPLHAALHQVSRAGSAGRHPLKVNPFVRPPAEPVKEDPLAGLPKGLSLTAASTTAGSLRSGCP